MSECDFPGADANPGRHGLVIFTGIDYFLARKAMHGDRRGDIRDSDQWGETARDARLSKVQTALSMNELNWVHGGTATAAAFLSSLVEFVEALTIVIAAGATRGWRSALCGTVAAAAILALLTLALGPAVQRIDLAGVQLVIGILLLLFGMRWARKAILRSARVLELHDESAAFGEEQESLRASGAPRGRTFDRAGFLAAFQGVFLEGLEVVFIVVAIGGADHNFKAAALGAIAAAAVVIAAGLMLHRPLTRVPENTLKYLVAVMICSFGTFWVGEGLSLTWPDQDWALFGLMLAYLIVFNVAVRVAVRRAIGPPTEPARTRGSS